MDGVTIEKRFTVAEVFYESYQLHPKKTTKNNDLSKEALRGVGWRNRAVTAQRENLKGGDVNAKQQGRP
jgi:hypothetical protein